MVLQHHLGDRGGEVDADHDVVDAKFPEVSYLLHTLIIEISDEGIGIPITEIDKIFDSFYRSKNADLISGTGLGLAICKLIVEAHSGKISAESEPGKLTVFRFTLPVNPPAEN